MVGEVEMSRGSDCRGRTSDRAYLIPPGWRRVVRLAAVLCGVGAALTNCAFVFRPLSSSQLAEPGLQAALVSWITLPYIVAGVIAWSRRPDSRFGPLSDKAI